MSLPKWITDLDAAAGSMPFGELQISVQRHRSKTTKVTYRKDYKLRPKDNTEAFSDLEKLINSLIMGTFTGKLAFDVAIKEGTILEITIKNKDIKNYRE